MARHKPKKKKKPSSEDPENKDLPPTEPIQSEDEKNYSKRKLDQLFWLRIGLAVLAGASATFIFDTIDGEDRRWASIGFMIAVFIISVGIGKGMNIQLPRSDRKKLVTTGLGSFVFIYLFMWILTYTIVNLPNESGIITPFT